MCDSETSKKIIFNINEDRIEVPKLDNRGINDRIRKEGYILFDAKRDNYSVQLKDSIQNEIVGIFGKHSESMLNQYVNQKQKYYEHILRPQIDEIIVITNIKSNEDILVKIDGEEIKIKELESVFLSEIKSDRIIFMNQGLSQTFQIYTSKQSKAKSLL